MTTTEERNFWLTQSAPLCVVRITGPSLLIEMRIDSHRAAMLMRAALDAALTEASINHRETEPNSRDERQPPANKEKP